MAHQFKNRDITRCLRAASAAGVRSLTMEIHLPGGTRYVVGGEVSAPETKKSVQRGAAYAEGGEDKMFKPQAANPRRPGRTAHAVKSAAPGSKRAVGGGPTPRAVGGVSVPAAAGQTGAPGVRKR